MRHRKKFRGKEVKMGFKEGNDDGFERSKTICWSCRNAVPDGKNGCSWSESFTPVEGWTALPPRSRVKGSYKVVKCPKYRRDENV